MNATTMELANCHRCRGTGTGLYNVLSTLSICEVCDGTGVAPQPESTTTHGPCTVSETAQTPHQRARRVNK